MITPMRRFFLAYDGGECGSRPIPWSREAERNAPVMASAYQPVQGLAKRCTTADRNHSSFYLSLEPSVLPTIDSPERGQERTAEVDSRSTFAGLAMTIFVAPVTTAHDRRMPERLDLLDHCRTLERQERSGCALLPRTLAIQVACDVPPEMFNGVLQRRLFDLGLPPQRQLLRCPWQRRSRNARRIPR